MIPIPPRGSLSAGTRNASLATRRRFFASSPLKSTILPIKPYARSGNSLQIAANPNGPTKLVMQMHKLTGNALLAAGALMALSTNSSHAQGCVAAHGSGVCMLHGDHGVGMTDDDSKWEGSLGYRFLNSGR